MLTDPSGAQLSAADDAPIKGAQRRPIHQKYCHPERSGRGGAGAAESNDLQFFFGVERAAFLKTGP